MVFDHSVRGLAVGSPIDFLGVELGTVTRAAPAATTRSASASPSR
jgi:hypothetical protein